MNDMWIVFRGGSHTVMDLCHGGRDPASLLAGDIWIPFVPVGGDMVIQNYDYSGTTLLYTPPIIVPPIQRNFPGFIAAIRSEPTFDSTMRMNLAGLLALFAADYQNPAALQQDTDDAIAVFGSTWLTSAVQAKLVEFATEFNIPMTSDIP